MSRKNNFIYCNCCGEAICASDKMGETSFLTIQKEWGYFSNEKDGEIHSMDICEPCYDELVRVFAIAPERKKVTEYL